VRRVRDDHSPEGWLVPLVLLPGVAVEMTETEIATAMDQLLSGVPTPSGAGAQQWIVDAVEVFLAIRAKPRDTPSLLIDVTTGRTKLLCSVCDKPVGAQFLLTLPGGSARHYSCDVHHQGDGK
jgi:hypothetical protein